LPAVFSGCGKSSKEQPDTAVENLSFRNIPGITQDEINAIEAIKTKYGSFVYGINPTTEAFIGKDGGIEGYAVMLCDWLSGMFEMPFRPVYYQWGDLLKGLESGEVHFTGELMLSSENPAGYIMSGLTVHRSIKYYRINNSAPLAEIIKTRPPRYAFLRGAVVIADITANTDYGFEPVFVDSHSAAYRMLESGEVDAFFSMDTAEGAFDVYGNVAGREFFPPVSKSSCLATQNEELRPVISALNKAMDNRVLEYLAALHKQGYQEYLGNKLYAQLTEEERLYIKERPIVPAAAEFNNYPVSFFDTQTKKWHGIYFETLDEVAKLTGLTFEFVNGPNMQIPELAAMLENGKALIIGELFRLKEYEGRFLWSETPLLHDNYAFITGSDFHNIETGEVSYLRVGFRKNTPYSELFKIIFPGHGNYTEYTTQEELWDALRNGEVDAIFSSRRRLLIYANYHEEAGFKLNLILDHEFDTSFGFNRDAAVLKSIVDKSLGLINIKNISNQWMNKTYDYRIKLAAAQRPWFIGASILIFLVLSLVSILLIRSRNAGKRLEIMVKQRTEALAFEGRQAMERELALQTSMLKTMISALPDAVFCKDLDFKYTLCNKYMANVFNKEVEDIIGKDDVTVLGLAAEAAAVANDTDKRVVNEQRRIVYEEWVRSNGVKRLFETVKSPLILDGEVIGVMGIGRDITHRKDMEEDLAFKTSKMQMIVDTIPDILFCKDTNFRYTQCNRQFEEFWGIQEAAIIGLSDHDGTWLSPDTIKNMHSTETTIMYDDKTFTSELSLSSPYTGKEGIFETVLSPLKQNGVVVGMMGIARDITQRKAMEEAVQAASHAKSAFFANMSHEIRTPLNVIIGLTDLILEDESLDSHVTGNLVKISSAGSMLLSIVNDILDFSKIESGKLELKPVEYATPSLLNDIVTLVVTRLGEKPIQFLLDIEDDLPAKLYGDDLRLKQIFTNLLTNAVKYTRKGSIKLSVRCLRGSDHEDDKVWMDIAVSDTGIGIREEDINKLFSDYNQVDTNANRNIEGTGLGLAITKKLTAMMDGKIQVESEYGKGSTFRLRLHQGFVSDTPIGADIADKLRNFRYNENKRIVSKKLVRIDLSYARVLVVDDMQTNLDVASGLLHKYNMQVDCVNSGSEAIERIRAGTPVYNAVFMDHMMPGMDGVEATVMIRMLGTEYAQKIPVIALTANAIHGTEEMFYEHGFQGFISKPIDVTEMDSVIRKWVRDETHEDVPVSEPADSNPADSNQADSASYVPFEIGIPGVNTEEGLSLYVGDMKVYLPLLRSYAANTPGTLDKLRSVSEETLPAYVISVHGLKGTSAGIGAQAIREAAMDLETKSRAGDLQGVLAKNEELIRNTEIVVANIKAWLQQYDAAHDVKPRRQAPDRKLLARLRQSCESYDIEDIDQAMSELESANYEEDADLVAWIREKIDISKMGEVAKRLAEMEEVNK
jgi:PAS domain S-box-containing protein